MEWTIEMPKEKGFYWFVEPGCEPDIVEYVTAYIGKTEYFYFAGDNEGKDAGYFCETTMWYGPIAVPETPY